MGIYKSGIEQPNPDGQFRLRNCGKCLSGNVGYSWEQNGSEKKWGVKCCHCGHFVEMKYDKKHDAQIAWNQGGRNG